MVDVSIGSSIDFLVLERLDEALRLGVIVGIADAAHARLDVVPFQQFGVVAARILHTAIGVVDQAAGHGLARHERYGERVYRQTRLKMRGQRPAHHTPAERIEDHRQMLGLKPAGDTRPVWLANTGRVSEAEMQGADYPDGLSAFNADWDLPRGY